jgi:hypothetical protein
MVARIVSGKSIRGILNYNELKVENAEAKLLMAAGFPRDPDRLSFKNKLERFELLTRQNTDTRTNTLHISLNFSNADILDEERIKAIVLDYMEGIGFGDQPFLLYQHFDAAHPHVHIATVNIAEGGERIETHNIGRNQSEKVRKEIEINYALVKAEDQKKEANYIPKAVSLDSIDYGKRETKAAIAAVVREVVGSYKFTSLPELNAILGQFNVYAYRGAEGTQMYQKGGLVYGILDSDGQPAGKHIKASSLYGNPTLKNLEARYGPNQTARKPYGERLKHFLDKAIRNSSGMEELKALLQQQGIRILLRENAHGQVYGLTYIDNATRAVFNGSDLGKAYSAKAFLERLQAQHAYAGEPRSKTFDAADASAVRLNHPKLSAFPAYNEPVIIRIIDELLQAGHEETSPDPFRKKKRKKLQND